MAIQPPPPASGSGSANLWKQFTFFDISPVKDAHDLAGSPHILQNAAEISTLAPSAFGVLVADIHGSVHVLDKEFEPATSWVAHAGGRVTHMSERRGILVTLGEEESVRYPLLKIWALEKTDKHGFPLLLRSAKVQPSSRPHPVTCLALSSTLAFLALGLGDGTVLLYRHLDQSIFSASSSLSALPKPRVLHESASEPATGLGFREPSEESPALHLFIATTGRVLVAQVSGKGSGGAPAEVHEVGGALGCAAMDWRGRDMVVARDESIYMCGVEGRGASYAYEGPKLSIQTHLNYLVIVSPPFAPSANSASATVRNFAAARGGSGGAEIAKVTVFDPENKLVAYSGPVTSGVRAVVSQWDKIYVLANDGALFCLQEKPTSEKLDMLYRKAQHLTALNLAKTQNLDEASVADIHRQFGDHMYAKGDYDNAMQQYLQTIGHVQPSYVIRKFLDAQRIHNLVTYLQELHARGVANSDHTTLLLNTYTKLKDVARLDSFIKTGASAHTDELPFDLDTAIRVCRQAGYFTHASYLAQRWARHEDYLRIQIEDAANFKDALAYLRRLGPEAAEHSLARYGRKMLEALPDETTQLLIDICTDPSLLAIDPDARPASPARQASTGPSGPSYLSYLALNRAPTLDSASPTTTVKPGEVPSRRGSVHDGSRTSTPPPATPTTATAAAAAAPSKPRPSLLAKRPSPRLYFANFVAHRAHFVAFLETVARRRWGQTVALPGTDSRSTEDVPAEIDPPADEVADRADQAAVWNTLLELYLASGADAKALAVLQDPALPCEPTHALVLCSARGFTRGLVLLWEQLGMHADVVRFWMERERAGERGAGAEVVRCLERFGRGEEGRYLYPLVLRFFTESAEVMERHREDLGRVLEVIEEEGIMPPLAVVQVLSRNGVASVGLVKEWLLARIREAREEVQTDKQLIDSYRLESQAKMKQVEELSDPDHPRIVHVAQCGECGGHLDLPSIHFMCNHSYHQRCLVNNETECPKCARAHAVTREIRRTNERLADQHDVFVADVRENGFAAVAAGFGRGVLNPPRADDGAGR